MEKSIEERLREAGDDLRASHDDDIIADVIGEVEALEDENADITAELLRTMVDLEEKSA